MKKLLLGLCVSVGFVSVVCADMSRVERVYQQHQRASSTVVHSSIHYAQTPIRSSYHDSFAYQSGRYIRPYESGRYIQPVNTYRRPSYQPHQRYPRPVNYERRYQPSCAPVRQVIYPNTSRYRYRTGEVIEVLPNGARRVYINNRRYYQYERYYFQPRQRQGTTLYVVVNL